MEKNTLERLKHIFEDNRSSFSLDEGRYLDQWLEHIFALESGKCPPRSNSDKKSLRMLSGEEPTLTKGMKIYFKLKALANEVPVPMAGEGQQNQSWGQLDKQTIKKEIVKLITDGKIVPKTKLNWLAEENENQLILKYLESILFTNIDGIKLKVPEEECQVYVNYGQNFKIVTLHDYVRTKDRTESDIHSKQIIGFKDGEKQWIRYYTEELDKVIAPNTVLCCSPSHDKDEWSSGLTLALDALGNRKNRLSIPHLMRRTKYTEKRTHRGSDRSLKKNLDTIEVTDKDQVSDRPVIVIDDVTTTGSTAAACVKKLWDAGCNCVGAIVLGHTIDTYHRSSAGRANVSTSELDDEIPF